jgi:hypothetical protein
LIVPNGSISFQLNIDATVIAAPYGFVAANKEVVFQFNSAGQIQPNAPDAAAQIYSNRELQPQLSPTLLGTYYLVSFFDQNGARINKSPMWWQFYEAANSTVDISNMTALSTVGGNLIFYPTDFATGTVTSIEFQGDGTVLSATPTAPITSAGILVATLLNQTNNLVFAGPIVGPAGPPTFRALVSADLPSLNVPWNTLEAATGNLVLANTTFNTTFNQTTAATWTWANITAATSLANQNSPFLNLAGTYWTGSASATDTWTWQDVVGGSPTLTLSHSGETNPAVSMPFPITVGVINSSGMTSAGAINILNASSLTFESSNNATQVVGQSSELLTLNTGGTTTDTTGNLLPAGAIIDAVVVRVTTTISGGSTPTTWEAGDATTAARFISTGTALTAGSTAVGLNQMQGGVSTNAAGPVQSTAAKVRITLDQTPGQGAVRITVFWRQFTAPTS